MFKIETNNGLRYGQFDELNGVSVISSFSLKNDAADRFNLALHTGDDPEKVRLSRKKFVSSFGIDSSRLSVVNQVHGGAVAVIDDRHAGRGALDYGETIEADALLTVSRNIPMMIFTADCVPLYLFDPTIPLAGLVHAGWQGAYKKILTNTVRTAVDRFNLRSSNLRVAIGPHIGPCCYGVGNDFKDKFDRRFFIEKDGAVKFDLSGPIREELENLGIPAKNVSDSGLCTCCNPDLCHSYRRDKSIFRHAAMIMLK